MTEKRILKNRSIFLLAAMVVLTIVLLGQLIGPSLAKYIKTEKDKIVAYYTALHLDTDGIGKTVSIENNQGFLNFKLMNFKKDNVTKRDIVYKIHTPKTFYDDAGNELVGDAIKQHANDPTKGIYVLDVWGTPKLIGKDTYKYVQSIVKTDAEVKEVTVTDNGASTTEICDAFIYEALGSGAVGKTHNITVQLDRRTDLSADENNSPIENISIVVHLIQPYEQVFIIDITVSNKLIVFSSTEVSQFEIPFQRVFIQTANIFSHVKGTGAERDPFVDDNNTPDKTEDDISYKMTSKAFKVVLHWDNLMLDEHHLDNIHIGIGSDPDNIDITTPYIVSIDSDKNKLEIYVPEASNIYLDFLVVDPNDDVLVEVDVYAYVLKGEKNSLGTLEFNDLMLVQYTQDTFYGYDFTNDNNMYTIYKG